jgi:hypothetical protein
MAARGVSWNRSPVSEQRKTELLDVLARRAMQMPRAELLTRLPGWSGKDLSHLRNRLADYFGWERLLYIADRFDIDVEIVVGREDA